MIVVKDNSVPLKYLKIGDDDYLIKKYASNLYIENLLRRRDNSTLTSQSALVPRLAGQDALMSSSLKNVYKIDANGPRKQEQGVKI